MARQITKTVYQYDELSERAKERALERYARYALDYEWWYAVYEDAARVGIKITAFDIGRRWSIDADRKIPIFDIASRILREHGESCDTWKTAREYVAERNETAARFEQRRPSDLESHEDWNYELEGAMDAIDDQFWEGILQCYLTTLRNEEEYLSSCEQLEEGIRANENEFYEDGSPA